MPGTRTDYGQVYDHVLNPLKGWSTGLDLTLEKSLPIFDGLDNKVYRGCVMHIATGNTWKLGTHATGSLTRTRVPGFAMANEDDPDVNPNLGNTAGGSLMGLVALGDFELESTEFDANGSYDVGIYLKGDDGSGVAAAGELAPGTLGTHVIVGIISEVGEQSNGSFEAEHGQTVIRFFTYFVPETVDAST